MNIHTDAPAYIIDLEIALTNYAMNNMEFIREFIHASEMLLDHSMNECARFVIDSILNNESLEGFIEPNAEEVQTILSDSEFIEAFSFLLRRFILD